MTRLFTLAAFLSGTAMIVWMTTAVVADNTMTLVVMLLIALAFLIGAIELMIYQRDNQRLDRALNSDASPRDLDSLPNDDFEHWINTLPGSLSESVRQRITGESIGLPAPVLTPYLVGLLVMLGLLGTFVGMVATLSGAVQALEGGTELSAIRAGLAAPIAGLGMAFGTSVAGVTASAVLGFMSVLTRKERIGLTRALDRQRGNRFKNQSLSHRREQAYEALQTQAASMPATANQLQALTLQLGDLASQISDMTAKMGQQLLDNQNQQRDALHNDFAALKHTVAESVNGHLAGIAEETATKIAPSVFELLMTLQTSFSEQHQAFMGAQAVASDTLQCSFQQRMEQLLAALAEHRAEVVAQDDQRNASLITTLSAHREQLMAREASHHEQFLSVMAAHQAAMTDLERTRSDKATAQLQELQAAMVSQVSSLSDSVIEPIGQLLESAAEAPKASAALVESLREATQQSLERDKALLVERESLVQVVGLLIEEIRASHKEQANKLAALLDINEVSLNDLSSKVADTLDNCQRELISTSGEFSNLSESFSAAVVGFNDANQQLITALANASETLVQSGARSDEQMAYYVAQAREVIDHNLMSQQTILDRLEEVVGALGSGSGIK